MSERRNEGTATDRKQDAPGRDHNFPNRKLVVAGKARPLLIQNVHGVSLPLIRLWHPGSRHLTLELDRRHVAAVGAFGTSPLGDLLIDFVDIFS